MEYPKWYGQCPSCRQWNTLKEQTVTVAPAGQSVPAWGVANESGRPQSKPLNILEVEFSEQQRINTSDSELVRSCFWAGSRE